MKIEEIRKLIEPLGFEYEEDFVFASPLSCSHDFEGCKTPHDVLMSIYDTGLYHGYNEGYEQGSDGAPHKYHPESKVYTIMLDDDKWPGLRKGNAYVSEEGAKLIYAAYIEQFGNSQSMDTREKRGGICWLSEINAWIKNGTLPKDFNWKKYELTNP